MNTRRPWIRLISVVAVSSALAATLSGCGEEDADPVATATDIASDTPSDQAELSEPASTSPAAGSSTSPATGASTVPAYFVADTPQGARLFREFRTVETGDALGAALTLAASGDALDPDYRTLLPSGTFHGGTWDEIASIPLPDSSWTQRPEGMSKSDALLAVQQLVYTAQGVLQERIPVGFTDADGNSTEIFGIASESGFTAADPIQTLGLVSVTSPEQGGSVRGSFTASGVASSFEATVPWQIRRGDEVVETGFTTAEGWADKLYPWETEVDVSGLPPGDYTFVAMTDDPSGGTEGGGPTEDSKSITVR